jgi:hypothetical protein
MIHERTVGSIAADVESRVSFARLNALLYWAWFAVLDENTCFVNVVATSLSHPAVVSHPLSPTLNGSHLPGLARCHLYRTRIHLNH